MTAMQPALFQSICTATGLHHRLHSSLCAVMQILGRLIQQKLDGGRLMNILQSCIWVCCLHLRVSGAAEGS